MPKLSTKPTLFVCRLRDTQYPKINMQAVLRAQAKIDAEKAKAK